MLNLLKERPITSTEHDSLGFTNAVDGVATQLRHAANDGEIFGVFGPWGAGKTSFLRLLAEQTARSCRWIDFDALRHQATTDVLTALVAHVGRVAHHNAQPEHSVEIKRSFWRVTRAASMAATDLALRYVANLKLDEIKKHLETAEAVELPESPADILRSELQKLVERLAANDQIVVLAIDNLDRCRPDAALRFIESLMLFREVAGLRVVVAADRAALIGFVDQQFSGTGFDGALYLEKMFQHTISIPSARHDSRLANDLVTLLPSAFSVEAREVTMDIVRSCSATRNPRRLKAIIRRLSRLEGVPDSRIDGADLIPLIFVAVVAETWPALLDFFWLTDSVGWEEMIAEANGRAGSRPDCVTDEAREFLRILDRHDRAGRLTQIEILRPQTRPFLDLLAV